MFGLIGGRTSSAQLLQSTPVTPPLLMSSGVLGPDWANIVKRSGVPSPEIFEHALLAFDNSLFHQHSFGDFRPNGIDERH